MTAQQIADTLAAHFDHKTAEAILAATLRARRAVAKYTRSYYNPSYRIVLRSNGTARAEMMCSHFGGGTIVAIVG